MSPVSLVLHQREDRSECCLSSFPAPTPFSAEDGTETVTWPVPVRGLLSFLRAGSLEGFQLLGEEKVKKAPTVHLLGPGTYLSILGDKDLSCL